MPKELNDFRSGGGGAICLQFVCLTVHFNDGYKFWSSQVSVSIYDMYID